VRYLVKARLKDGKAQALCDAIENRTLGLGSVAGGEYIRNMNAARLLDDGSVTWVEVCYCRTPLEEERPYWEEYFELESVKNAHARANCRDYNGEERRACSSCDCTDKLEETLASRGPLFIHDLTDEDA